MRHGSPCAQLPDWYSPGRSPGLIFRADGHRLRSTRTGITLRGENAPRSNRGSTLKAAAVTQGARKASSRLWSKDPQPTLEAFELEEVRSATSASMTHAFGPLESASSRDIFHTPLSSRTRFAIIASCMGNIVSSSLFLRLVGVPTSFRRANPHDAPACSRKIQCCDRRSIPRSPGIKCGVSRAVFMPCSESSVRSATDGAGKFRARVWRVAASQWLERVPASLAILCRRLAGDVAC
jgi:hypothetical protein